GDPAVPFVAEAWCRGLLAPDLRDNLYAAMQSLLEKRPPGYLERGYAPTAKPANPVAVVDGGPREAGTTLEYGIAEFAAALMASSSGRTADATGYARRSLGYRTLL